MEAAAQLLLSGGSGADEDDAREGVALPLSPAEVMAAWQAVDLPSVQLALDEQAETIASHTEQRLEARKELSTLTKAFRAKHPDKDAERDELLKHYQQAIDQVSSFHKFGGNAFLVLFRILRQLPDPVVGLNELISGEMQARSQIASMEAKVDALVAALEKSREKLKGREQNQAERERFQEQVQLDSEAVVAQAVHEAEARLLHAQQRHEDEVARLQAQIDAGQAEIDRLQETMASLPRHSAVVSDAALALARSEGEKAAQAQAAMALEVAQRSAAEATRAYEEQVAELQSRLTSKMDENTALKAHIAKLPSEHAVEKLRAQLAVIRGVQARARGEESEPVDPGSLDSLEAWLLEANQRLQTELSTTKELLGKAEARLQQATHSLAVADATPTDGSALAGNDDALSLATMKAQRDRLRAVVERRDVRIEQLQNEVEDRDQRLRSLEGEIEALKQRVRFLQSYKMSERSTLVGGGRDVEAQLGRGVSHQFRGMFEKESETWVDRAVLRLSGGLLSRSRGRLFFVFYGALLHGLVIFAWASFISSVWRQC